MSKSPSNLSSFGMVPMAGTVDGLRVDFSDGWGLVRASNTEPALTLRFEADNEQALDETKGEFKELLQELRKDLTFE